MTKCSTCDSEAVHYLEYDNLTTLVGWIGRYCGPCFVKKLRGMVTAWSKRK